MKILPRSMEEAQEQEAVELLERRASRLREQAETTVEEAVHWIAEFPLGEERYALSLEMLRAALPLRMVTPVPLSSPHVVGVLRFQGQVLSALSLASMLGGHGWRQDPAVLLVVDRGDGELCALDCEAIPRPTTLPASAVEAARVRAEGPVMEVFTQDRQLIHLIDLKRLFTTRSTGGRNAR
ncbi:chemotaxis protein CheW [Myxococcus sp. MISCRS1]|jgi:purine-binding chemotaxis protein CheW|uniref:chemotaxis protein CheW n=1 Tax=Myxococcus TaxID=32 RepID=UPI0011428BFD|nr:MULTISPECIES: chemotaxis protein CheW [Myxococcus]BDT37116.1 chemotaxis protein CheW [Myxococcus sp. MH1]MBZ4394345.1 chemotaxis protein CheW [Myxococcus sp. AS-1-15]MBZ4410439.1 chemotaxis protein CheW [Myxococcus sp. XM-1-1-1]MCK8502990.1 chemotaxis protein CheW [Myxococcus fulvus]MCP3062165.1 chemotaxis protein CheW [Myxococcus guangdongensis]